MASMLCGGNKLPVPPLHLREDCCAIEPNRRTSSCVWLVPIVSLCGQTRR